MLRSRLVLCAAASACLGLMACQDKGGESAGAADLSRSQAQTPTSQPPAASNVGTDPAVAAAANNSRAPVASEVGQSDGSAQAAYNAANPPPRP